MTQGSPVPFVKGKRSIRNGLQGAGNWKNIALEGRNRLISAGDRGFSKPQEIS